MRFISLDIASHTTGYSIFFDKKFITSGIIDVSKSFKECWIPEGEWRTDKELYVTKKGKKTKRPDNIRRSELLKQRLILQTTIINILIKVYNIDYIVKEQPIQCKDGRVTLELGESHSVITSIKKPVISHYPTTWRNFISKIVKENNLDKNFLEKSIDKNNKDMVKLYKKFTNKTNENKLDYVLYFLMKEGKLPLSNDESDSYSLGYYHLLNNTHFSYDNLMTNTSFLNCFGV